VKKYFKKGLLISKFVVGYRLSVSMIADKKFVMNVDEYDTKP
jgi:hypothetical protein